MLFPNVVAVIVVVAGVLLRLLLGNNRIGPRPDSD